MSARDTHPWIKFQIDLRGASYALWMLFGEARSKCRHLSDVPLKPRVAERLHALYLAKGVHATTAIEGNTLTEEQVADRLAGRLELPKSQRYLQNEVDNVVSAINWIGSRALGQGETNISLEEILEVNRLVLDGLDVEPPTVPGELRRHGVGVGNYGAPDWQECEGLLSSLATWLNGPQFTPDGEDRIPMGVLRAILVHLYIAWIHPFGDGNGRTARALEFKILLVAGVPTPAAHLLSNHYNKTRQEYYRQLALASAEKHGAMSFVKYALQGFVDGLQEQLDVVWQQQYEIAWESFVHGYFKGSDKPKDKRQRTLVLALSEQGEPQDVSQLRLLTPKVAAIYAKTSPAVIFRDLDDLITGRLILKTPRGYKANRESILAFRPRSLAHEGSGTSKSSLVD